jgi:hypothetical protein
MMKRPRGREGEGARGRSKFITYYEKVYLYYY